MFIGLSVHIYEATYYSNSTNDLVIVWSFLSEEPYQIVTTSTDSEGGKWGKSVRQRWLVLTRQARRYTKKYPYV